MEKKKKLSLFYAKSIYMQEIQKKAEILQLVRELFNKFARYKMQYGKISGFPITQHKELGNERYQKVFLKDTTDSIIKNIKYEEIDFTKDVQNLYQESHITSLGFPKVTRCT